MKYDIIIIGAGVTGAFIARSLSQYKLNILLLDKENDVGNVTSMANSAIIHSGYDPVPGTLKAKLNVLGNKMYPEIAKELDVEFIQKGSLTVAVNDDQLKMLESLKTRSEENGVEVKILSASEVLEKEPNITKEVKGALFAPSAGIINPFTLVVHCVENAVDNGVKLELNEEVIDIKQLNDGFIVKTKRNEYESRALINCAGLYSDKIHSLIEPIDYDITPRKGEYFVLDHYGKMLVNTTIFPLPSEKGKGVLVSPTTSLNFIVGPSSEPMKDKDDVSTDKATLDDIRRQANLLVPSIPFNQTIRSFSGVRPTPSTHDFIIGPAKSNPYFINVSGIESPGLASAPAIAIYVIDNFVSKLFALEKKEDFNPFVKKRAHLKDKSVEEINELIKENPLYGHIICNCEKVSLGEIIDEFKSSVPPHTIKAMKKRTRAGFGKCQGGFCQPLVLKEIAKYFNVPISEILLDKNESFIAHYLSKEEE